MALIECKECKNEVSSSAKTCPHCGVDSPGVTFTDILMGLVVILVGILVVIWAFS